VPTWLPRVVVLAATVLLLALPAMAHRGSAAVGLSKNRKTSRERALLALVAASLLLGIVGAATPWLGFADYVPRWGGLVAGVVAYALGLALLYKTHRDLGAWWSITLEVKESHALVTHGVYARLRHPMYSALLLYGVGQALSLPNYVAGPAYLGATVLMVAMRLGPEERMLAQAFPAEYPGYVARTKRLVPGVW
jgi:protein-S-isoprenylcysteine O-methyltransferase Ste14